MGTGQTRLGLKGTHFKVPSVFHLSLDTSNYLFDYEDYKTRCSLFHVCIQKCPFFENILPVGTRCAAHMLTVCQDPVTDPNRYKD